MKNLIAVVLLLGSLYGSFKIGAYYQNERDLTELVPWAMDNQREQDKQAWQEFNSALYDWKRPIRAVVYIGCTEKRPLIANNIMIDGTDFDYGIWMACTEEPLEMFGVTLELGKPR